MRLTSPDTSSILPAAQNRSGSTRGHYLLFASNRTGAFAPFRLDLKTGALQQLAECSNLQPRSLALDPAERRLLFLDGKSLREVSLGTKRIRVLRDNVDGFSVAASGELLLVTQGRLETDRGQVLARHVNAPVELSGERNGCFFLARKPAAGAVPDERGDSADLGAPGESLIPESSIAPSWTRADLWWAQIPTAGVPSGQPKLLAEGSISDPFAHGDAVLYLRRDKATEIWQTSIGGQQQLLAPGTQLGSFAPNRNASVFVAASRSKAQPLLLLILRANRRELVLCEHHASTQCRVSPVFSLDSRRVYFNSDRDGKPAIYSVNVESLVEPT